jgi:hypothetical protein
VRVARCGTGRSIVARADDPERVVARRCRNGRADHVDDPEVLAPGLAVAGVRRIRPARRPRTMTRRASYRRWTACSSALKVRVSSRGRFIGDGAEGRVDGVSAARCKPCGQGIPDPAGPTWPCTCRHPGQRAPSCIVPDRVDRRISGLIIPLMFGVKWSRAGSSGMCAAAVATSES